MEKIYKLTSDGHIAMTADTGSTLAERFDFPEDFDFSRQSFYKIIDNELIEDMNAVTEYESGKVRAKRDQMLSKSDFTVLPDSPFTDEEKSAWAVYRQKLRDIPDQPGFPFDVIFPQKPE